MFLPGQHVHVVGVAGVGMNAVAQVLLGLGLRVTGSDRFFDQDTRLPVLDKLEGLGVQLHPQDGSALSADTAGVIISTAIEATNPDRQRAEKLEVPVIHRATALARASRNASIIAIAGTAGKSTTTGMCGWLLEACGLNPSVVNGAGIANWIDANTPGNVRLGTPDLWILEADESDRSLLVFRPDWAVISNISQDHFNLGESVDLFRQFAGQVQKGIVCGPGVAELLQGHTGARLIEATTETLPLSLPGAHNQENARLAYTLCQQLGAHPGQLRGLLPDFRGIERRLERMTDPSAAIQVFDDYAHNPGKIAAAWKTFHDQPGTIHGIWRPHGYGPLSANADALAEMFQTVCRDQDQLHLLPVFYAGGTAGGELGSEDFVQRLKDRKVPARYHVDYGVLEARLREILRPNDIVLIMGARDPALPRFARRMASPGD